MIDQLYSRASFVSDMSLHEFVRRQLDRYANFGQDANESLAHLSGDVRVLAAEVVFEETIR